MVAYTKAMRDCLPLLPEDAQAEMLRELEWAEAMLPYEECMEGYVSYDDEFSQSAYTRGMRECLSLAPEDQRAEMEEWLVEMEAMLPYEECMDGATVSEDEQSRSAYTEGMKSCVDLAPEDQRSRIEEQIASAEAWVAHEECVDTEMGGPGWWNEEWTEESQDRYDDAYASCAHLEPEYGEVGVLEDIPMPDDSDAPTAPGDYGLWIGGSPDMSYTADWVDADGDSIDDRWQAGPGLPDWRQTDPAWVEALDG